MNKLEEKIEVAKLEEEAAQKLEAEVLRIFERYGNNAADLIKYGSDYEKDLVFRWEYPKAVEEFLARTPVDLRSRRSKLGGGGI